jgi:hypothetical protein
MLIETNDFHILVVAEKPAVALLPPEKKKLNA